MRRFLPLIFVFAFLASSCIFDSPEDNNNTDQDVETDTSSDAGTDVETDTSSDAGTDVETDTSSDADGVDSDTAPECTAPAQECGGTCVDTTTSNEHCGSCDDACAPTGDGYLTTCVDSMCESTGDCAEDYVDLDGDDSNGCECEITDPADPPGDGDDANCDGIDGNRSAALFVKEGATGDGFSADTPTGSLSDALSEVAGDADFTQILVAQGSYPPFSLVSDVTIAGGYSGNFQAYDPSSHETVVARSADATGAGDVTTVDAQNVENSVVVSLRIVAADPVDPGASTVAVHAENSDFELRALTLEGGQAAGGNDGEPVSGAVSCSEYAGGDGGQPATLNPCDNGTPTAPYGSNGEPGGSAGTGGAGGEHECAGSVQQPTCTSAIEGSTGQNGEFGTAGTDGSTPSSGVGAIANGFWAPATGSAPAVGAKGTGGGGGGAGGNCGSDLGTNFVGGQGGRGGDGGCGGKAGNNGQPGGASILILSVGSDVTLTDVTGIPGTGGKGGAGSKGGDGGSGDLGSAGNTAQGGAGGYGGNGGNGGAGGDGAGGCGGPSYGVAFNSASTITGELDIDTGETFDAGQAGNGANDAPDGCDGVASSEQEL